VACGKDAAVTDPRLPAQSEGEPARATAAGRRETIPAATLLEARPFASPTLGALHGTVMFVGTPPERFPQGAAKSAECKHHPEVDQRQNLVVVNEGKLSGAFVRLASGFDAKALPPLVDAPLTLDQKGCMYVPRVLGLRVGQTLRVTNLDPTAHNVHMRPKRNLELNKTMGKGQAALEFRFERPEWPVPISCDIHPWMGAAVFVEEHPWFAVSDAQGDFEIRAVPPGEYVVEVLHERLAKRAGRASVQAGQSTGVTFTLTLE
jgi:plastocyanin